MKLATLKNGSRDGRMLVVSRDLSRAVDAGEITPTLRCAQRRGLGQYLRLRSGCGQRAPATCLAVVGWLVLPEPWRVDAKSVSPRPDRRCRAHAADVPGNRR